MIGVYGANGFIGRHLVRRLASTISPLRAISRRFDDDFSKLHSKGVEFLEADFTHTLSMASSLQDIDTVVQLISSSSPGLKNDHAIADIQENVIPHVEFLETCIQAGVRRYIFISSGGTVYGPNAIVPTPEASPTNPINSHGLTKLITEKYIQMYGHVHGLNYVILRVANPFGPGQVFKKGQGLVASIFERYLNKQPIRIFGDGSARRDYIYIDNVIEAIIRSIHLPGSPKLILNVGAGESRSIMEVVETIEHIVGHHIQRQHVGQRSTDVDVACLDISQAKKVLAWQPAINFADGLKRTAQAYQSPT